MKLYDKKIASLSALESEKRLLLEEKQRLEQDKILTLDGIVDSVTSDIKGSAGKVLEGLLPNSSSFLAPVFSLVSGIVKNRLFSKKSEKKDSIVAPHYDEPEKKKSNVVGTIAKEVIGSYLKWKAVELTYKGITLSVRKHKKKKAENATATE